MLGTRVASYARKHRFAASLTAITVLGFVWRVVYAVSLRHVVVGSDGVRYHFGALFLADGQGFVAPLTLILRNVHVPDTGHPPGWTILLAGATKLGMRTWLEHGLFASGIGAATVAMTGLAAKAGFGPRVGLIAAALAAAYPNFFLYERQVLSETPAMLGVATTIWLAYKFLAAPRRGLAIALGAVVGLLAMTKSDQIAIAFVLVAPLILSRRTIDLRRRVAWLAMAAATCVVIMAPWSIYLSTRFDRPVVVSGAFGATMAAGNCAQTYTGERLGWFDFGCSLPLGSGGDPITIDARARTRALNFMRAHERRLPVVMGARVGRTFSVFRPFQQLRLEYGGGIRWGGRWGLFMYWALLPLAAAGAVLARRRRIPIAPLLVFPAVVLITVLLTIGAVRYRAPAEVPLVILSAATIDAAVASWRRHRAAPHAPSAAVTHDSPTVAIGL